MTSIIIENDDEIMLGEMPDRIIKCSRCSGWADVSWFENVSDLSNLFVLDNHRDFKFLEKITGEIVSTSRQNKLHRFEFSTYDLAESFYNSVNQRVNADYPDRIFCLSFPQQFNENYVVTYYAQVMDFYCENCTFHCENCNDDLLNYGNTIITFEGDNICEGCYENNFFTCENCDNVFNSRYSHLIYDRDASWCTGCSEDEATWCDYHDSFEQDLCDNNYHESDNERWNNPDYEGIFPWSFKPARPDFFLGSLDSDNQKLTFGFELEIESESCTWSEGIKIIKDCLGDFVYMKGDGSLNDGYEIVSYPFSFNYYQEGIDFGFLKQLKDIGYRSWTPETCGFHIHIGRTGFESAGHIWKFANLILQNPNSWQKLAGRSGERWATFSMQHNQVMKVLKGELNPERYVAVNMCNAETIEVRFFRGSLNETRIRSAIESIYLAIEYTRTLSVHEINNGGLSFEHFVNYLVNKGFFANGFKSFKTLLEKYDLVCLTPATPESEI